MGAQTGIPGSQTAWIRHCKCIVLTSTNPDKSYLGTAEGDFNPLSANFTKWPNTLKQLSAILPTNCLGLIGHFVGLALKGLRKDTTTTQNHLGTSGTPRKQHYLSIFGELKRIIMKCQL